jgi:hypothetical protein
METMIINVCEAYAKDEPAAQEARKNWTVRSLTLDLMYDNIPGLQTAALDTKNYIYDKLQEAINKIV